jgi:hypothetical protein
VATFETARLRRGQTFDNCFEPRLSADFGGPAAQLNYCGAINSEGAESPALQRSINSVDFHESLRARFSMF